MKSQRREYQTGASEGHHSVPDLFVECHEQNGEGSA